MRSRHISLACCLITILASCSNENPRGVENYRKSSQLDADTLHGFRPPLPLRYLQTVQVCGDYHFYGWLKERLVSTLKCKGKDNQQHSRTWLLIDVRGAPIGTKRDVCAPDAIGNGWAAVSGLRDGPNCPNGLSITVEKKKEPLPLPPNAPSAPGWDGNIPAWGERKRICSGTLPEGWALTNVLPEATCTTSKAWEIVNLVGAPIGAQVDVCYTAMTPRGWFTTRSYTVSRCGWQADPGGYPRPDNVEVIEKR
jgi:hypothetical protein